MDNPRELPHAPGWPSIPTHFEQLADYWALQAEHSVATGRPEHALAEASLARFYLDRARHTLGR